MLKHAQAVVKSKKILFRDAITNETFPRENVFKFPIVSVRRL